MAEVSQQWARESTGRRSSSGHAPAFRKELASLRTYTIRTTVKRRSAEAGFSIIELLIVVAIVGIIAAVVVMAGRPIVRGQEGAAAVKSMQQSVWQGATMAASRGVRTNLVYTGTSLEVRNATTDAVIRSFELPAGASLNVTAGSAFLQFTPPGKVDAASLASLPSPLRITTTGGVYDLQISLIGEVKVTGG